MPLTEHKLVLDAEQTFRAKRHVEPRCLLKRLGAEWPGYELWCFPCQYRPPRLPEGAVPRGSPTGHAGDDFFTLAPPRMSQLLI